MARRIVVRFQADRDMYFYSRVLNWAESLYHDVVSPGYGEIHDLDRASDKVIITVTPHRQVARIMKRIRKTLPQHFRDCEPVIEGPT